MTFVLSHVMVLFILALAGQCSRYNIVLKDWTFRLSNTTQDYPANIPSSLSLDLIENRLVANDPYYRDNFLSFYKF